MGLHDTDQGSLTVIINHLLKFNQLNLYCLWDKETICLLLYGFMLGN